MATIAFRFPARRYHATPWGHHVNEGLVEWPPSPWRILRALIAVGYTTLGWRGVPESARRLVERLATVLPTYRVPAASLGHSRHYMPIGGLRKDTGVEQTTLVFDAWATVEDGEILVSWAIDLPEDERALLGSLAARMGYLGRSESWVDARVVDDSSVGTAEFDGGGVYPCVPGDHPGAGWEQVALLAPETPGAYEAFRAARAERTTTEGVSGKSRRKAVAGEDCPRDLVGCLEMQTSELQAQGWSQPPGSRRVLYWRRSNALEAGAPPAAAATTHARPVEAALLALAAPNGSRGLLPRCGRTLMLAEALHDTLVRGPERIEELIGKGSDGAPLKGHRHAHVLPLDQDGDGHIDHVLVWAPRKLSAAAQTSVRRVRRVYAKDVSELRVALEGLSDVAVLRDRMSSVFGPPQGSTAWISATPFVPPRHLRGEGAHSFEGQLRAELASRGLPELASYEILTRDEMRRRRLPSFRHFVLERSKGPPPPVRMGYGLRIVLSEAPRSGPICLGYGSHFGLGRFEAAMD
jgi:CRISPR-associated protein Csb2